MKSLKCEEYEFCWQTRTQRKFPKKTSNEDMSVGMHVTFHRKKNTSQDVDVEFQVHFIPEL